LIVEVQEKEIMIIVGISIVGMNMKIGEMMLIMIDEDGITSKNRYQVPIRKLKRSVKVQPHPLPFIVERVFLKMRKRVNLIVCKNRQVFNFKGNN